MRLLRSLAISFSMFSRLPMPRVEWNPQNMRYTMVLFPLVGLPIGAAAVLWGWVVQRLALPPFAMAVGLTLLPILITGGIHLDGFCDTADALASHAGPEKAQEILKDPHAGAFACISLGCYLLGYAGLASLVPAGNLVYFGHLAVVYVLCRAMSGLAVVSFPIARDSGLAHTFADAAARRTAGIALGIMAAICSLVLLFLGGFGGMAAVAAAWLVYAWYHRVAKKRFGGLSGDLAGWFLQLCELFCLAGLVLVPAIQGAF